MALSWSLPVQPAQAGIWRERLCSRLWCVGGACVCGCGRALCVCVCVCVCVCGGGRGGGRGEVGGRRDFHSQKSPRPAPAAAWRLHRAGLPKKPPLFLFFLFQKSPASHTRASSTAACRAGRTTPASNLTTASATTSTTHTGTTHTPQPGAQTLPPNSRLRWLGR